MHARSTAAAVHDLWGPESFQLVALSIGCAVDIETGKWRTRASCWTVLSRQSVQWRCVSRKQTVLVTARWQTPQQQQQQLESNERTNAIVVDPNVLDSNSFGGSASECIIAESKRNWNRRWTSLVKTNVNDRATFSAAQMYLAYG